MTRRLTFDDAIQIWIRRWLGDESQAIILHYKQNPLRVYEVWWEEKFIGSRITAMNLFKEKYPKLAKTADFSRLIKQRTVVSRKSVDPNQPSFFD